MARPRKVKEARGSASAGPSRMQPKAIIYARVSTAEQEREGFSIDAQISLLREYASCHGFNVAEQYVDVETAKRTGRTQFELMLRYLKAHPGVRNVLVEKTDRIYRNIKDWVTLDAFDIELHLVKEGTILSRDSRSSEKFMHGIKVLMAKNYVDNLSEESRKGMAEKARQGIWPTQAPIGYLNVVGPMGKKIIVPDEAMSPVVARLFEWFETGTYSLKQITEKVVSEGLRYRKSGLPVGVSTVHKTLRNRLYAGTFEWGGKLYQGSHQPLISQETWQNVQNVLDGRSVSNVRAEPLRFAFTGLVTCGHCGCAVVAQLARKRYIYYHCSGFKGKCPEKYAREETLVQAFAEQLARLRIDEQVFQLVSRALREANADRGKERNQTLQRLRAEVDRFQERLDRLYIDHIDGKITADTHDRMASKWREERASVLAQLEAFSNADDEYIDEGIGLLELARNAHRSFKEQPPEAKNAALKLLLSNSLWANGKMIVTFREPFALLEEFSPLHLLPGVKNDPGKADRIAWLPE